jgi:hypothetical protein
MMGSAHEHEDPDLAALATVARALARLNDEVVRLYVERTVLRRRLTQLPGDAPDRQAVRGEAVHVDALIARALVALAAARRRQEVILATLGVPAVYDATAGAPPAPPAAAGAPPVYEAASRLASTSPAHRRQHR